MRLILEVKNPTEELTGICTFHFGRGIFRYAQYDVRTPIVGFADTLPEGESEISFTVFASMPSEQTCLQGFASDGIHKTIGVLKKTLKTVRFL